MWSKICWEKNEPFLFLHTIKAALALLISTTKRTHSEHLTPSASGTPRKKRQTGNEEKQNTLWSTCRNVLMLSDSSFFNSWLGDFHVKDIKRVSYFPSERTCGSNRRGNPLRKTFIRAGSRWEDWPLTCRPAPMTSWYGLWHDMSETVANPTERKFISTALSR